MLDHWHAGKSRRRWSAFHNRTQILSAFLVVALSMMGALIEAAEKPGPLRSLRVPLPGQQENAIKTSWPGIGCWFWTDEEFKPDGYKRFLDLHEKHSAFGLLTTSIRHPVEVTEPRVHDQIRAAALYARQRGMDIVMDLDVRLARRAFQEKYPDELQEIVRLREVSLAGEGEAIVAVEALNMGDHYTFAARGYDSVSGRVLRVFSYVAGTQGIEPGTIQDISSRCAMPQADAKGVRVTIPCRAEDLGRTACVMAAFTLFTPDVFAPHLIAFERDVLKQYGDVPLGGACKDEWGFPGRFAPRQDDFYYSRFMADAYGARRPGNDLATDLLLMCKAQKGRGAERAAAINHWMEMNWQRNGEIETAFYRSTKEVFGKDAMVATHPTWFPYPNENEVFKNGLDWWAAKRDLAQTDEATPFCVRTALAKKWSSPLWFNMYYDSSVMAYEEDLWRHVLGGGRMNFHPLWPNPAGVVKTSLLSGRLLAADGRVRLLNYISTAPIDCPVAVVFGHPSALNWAGPGMGDAGVAIADGLWREGFYADLIPSSEIVPGNLTIADDGSLNYGAQRYAAAVFYHPQYERPAVAQFFQKAVSKGKTALFRVGEWTVDFEGNSLDAASALPATIEAVEPSAAIQKVVARLRALGVAPQTPCAPRSVAGFPSSMMPRKKGQCRLLDGTIIIASGERDVQGDRIQETLNVRGWEVAFDAVGVAAVRLDKSGQLDAMAAGGLKSFHGGGRVFELPERVDMALWRDDQGRLHGVLQDWTGAIPPALAAITGDWQLLAVPKPLE
jgi:hypothetical protein